MSDDILDYADLVARYETGLVDNLRSFGFQTEYLDLWVPDADLSRSLLNLFNAAAEVGQSSLTVRIPAGALGTLQAAGFPAQAAKHGELSIEEQLGGGAVLRITNLHVVTLGAVVPPTAGPVVRTSDSGATGADLATSTDEALLQPATLPEPYAAGLRAADKAAPAPSGHSGLISARAEIDGLIAEVSIDPQDHVIHGFTVTGAHGPDMTDLMAVLARICLGLPVFEAADHGAIRLEHLLRGDAPRPRPGIIIPETINLAFRLVSALLRAILADYRVKTGFSDRTNTFDVTPGPRWMTADEDGRRAQLTEAFIKAGFQPEDVGIVAIEYDVRVVISLGEALAKDPARSLAALERQMKRSVDGRLELFLSEVKDSNKLRRLSEQKGTAR